MASIVGEQNKSQTALHPHTYLRSIGTAHEASEALLPPRLTGGKLDLILVNSWLWFVLLSELGHGQGLPRMYSERPHEANASLTPHIQ
jgi:hypothetical protein